MGYKFIIVGVLFLIFIILSFLNLFTPKDYDCADFDTKKEAMAKFKELDYDKYRLDANNNGIPCEELP